MEFSLSLFGLDASDQVTRSVCSMISISYMQRSNRLVNGLTQFYGRNIHAHKKQTIRILIEGQNRVSQIIPELFS